ncbi:MAG: retron system putative HNH endonuclease [Pseudomonadota bacterium]
MIKVKRADKPPILVQKAKEWTETLLAAQTKKDRQNAESKYQHKQIKDCLVKMFHGKCAYCESQIRHIDYGHIEHYRPKSKFHELTYSWNNLLLACGVCNDKAHKGDKFPLMKEGGLLINPCIDNPDAHFNFYYDPQTCIASVYGTTQRGETTEKLLGLNRDELRKHRSKQVRQLQVLVKLSETDSDAKALIAEAKQDDAEYAAFIRELTK